MGIGREVSQVQSGRRDTMYSRIWEEASGAGADSKRQRGIK